MKRFILFTLISIFALQLQAQKRYDEIEFPELNNFQIPEVEEFQLDNGITFYLVEDKELPLISLNVLVKTGSILVPAEKAGLASMVGQVMREGGSENYPADKLNVLLEDNAASIGSFIGFGSGSATLSLLKEDFDELLPVFVDFVQNPVFPEDKIELAKVQAKSGISRRNDDQASIASREFGKLIYGENSVYTKQTEYETIDAISRDDLVSFHNDAFVGNNMMIGVIGDFDTGEMKAKLRDAFGSLPGGQQTSLIYPEVDYNYPSTINFINKPDVNQSYVLMGHIGGLRENPDYAALQVMNQVLSGGFSGRLFQTVRTDMGLAYSVGGSYGSGLNYPGTFRLTVMTKSSTTAEAIDAILAEVRKIQEAPVSQKELEDTKDRFLNSLIFRYDSKGKILNERISNEYNGLSQDAFDKLVEEIKAVDISDIQRVAKEYLRPDQVQILVVGNEDELGDQLQKYGNVNDIDITIPQPASEETTETGDKAQGQEWLGRMAEAIAGPSAEVQSITTKGNQTISTPMGEQNLGFEVTTDYSTGDQSAKINIPQGVMEMELKDGKGVQRMAGQEFPMQPGQVNQMQQEFKRSYLNIAINRSTLDAEYLGTEEIDGTEYVKLKINFDTPVTYYLDPETSLPGISQVSAFNPQAGGNQTVRTEYSEWNEVDNVRIAFVTVSYADGEKVSTQNIDEASVEN